MYPTSQRIAQSTYSLFPDSNRCVPTTKSIPRACTKSIRLPKKSKLLLPAFLSKIFEIFGQAEYTGICGWNADGDTIMITCSEAFIASVLPRFFKHRNFPSFVRQLNLYGFHKTVLDSKRLEFQHPFFKRNRPELLHYIRRKNPVSHPRRVESRSVLKKPCNVSDSLLNEIKILVEKNQALEKRLKEMEVDTNRVTNDYLNLWKHLETSNRKQILMQEKMRAIMWRVYTDCNSQSSIANRDRQMLTEGDESTLSVFASSDCREVMRYLAMEDLPMLTPVTSREHKTSPMSPRKRKLAQARDVSPETLSSNHMELEDHVHDMSVLSVSTNSSSAMYGTPSQNASSHTSSVDVHHSYQDDRYWSTVSMPPSIMKLSQYHTQSPTRATCPNPQKEVYPIDLEALEFTNHDLPDIHSNPHLRGHDFDKLDAYGSSLLGECDVDCLDIFLQSYNEKDFMIPGGSATS
uniref:Uncharacterized protein AlNc14C65G4612 n=1 Tax=Albugo laibachii Nc14 TaxID=890382 RepID=F0WD92_9STRA|nr:cleavage induced conserved hypothetical protein [Albugo laibachii Nc14]|eukprot:CCA19164.1 cleavage induced conserved hypothetical protein [Albugo laibachii Nc14]